MIGYLQGVALGEELVLTEGGVGYAIHCVHPLETGESTALYVTTVVRENSIVLYGFENELEQIMFAALNAVQGVGPQVALSLLRDLTLPGLAAGLVAGDAKALTAAAGVGRKLADRIVASGIALDQAILDLLSGGEQEREEESNPNTLPQAVLELVSTLEGLGYAEDKALEAAQAAHNRVGEGDDAALMRAALAHLRGAA